MTHRSLARWATLGISALLVTACGMQAAPAPVTPAGPAAITASEDRGKPPEYEKIFPALYRPQPYPVKVIAHRGYSRVAPENTMAAIQAAIDAGADAVEFDIRLSKDGHVVVIHDGSVDRTTNGHGKVSDMTLSELRTLDAGGWFGPEFKGERIPTLEEALLAMRGKVTPVIEVKSSDRDLTAAMIALLRRLDMLRHVYVTTFYATPLKELQQHAPEVPRSVLVTPGSSFSGRALAMRAGTTQGYYRSLDKGNVDYAHSLGLQIHAWTVNRASDMLEMIEKGVDGITTDEVEDLRTVLKAKYPQKPPINPHVLWGILYPVDRKDTPPVSVYGGR